MTFADPPLGIFPFFSTACTGQTSLGSQVALHSVIGINHIEESEAIRWDYADAEGLVSGEKDY